MQLNQMKISDYFFGNAQGKTLQFSRKQSGELLADIDEAERQLRRYYDSASESYQIVEGIISPVPLFGDAKLDIGVPSRTKLWAYHVTDSGFVKSYRSAGFNVSSARYWSWIHRLGCCGISTYYTFNWLDTARMLVAVYNNEQKPEEEHGILQRYTKPKVYIKEHDPFIQDMLYFNETHRCGVGIKKATALRDAGYGSLFDVMTAYEEELAEIVGVGQADKLLKAIGRKE